jgi:hypothetical protein
MKELGMALDLVPGTMDQEEESAAIRGVRTHAH